MGNKITNDEGSSIEIGDFTEDWGVYQITIKTSEFDSTYIDLNRHELMLLSEQIKSLLSNGN